MAIVFSSSRGLLPDSPIFKIYMIVNLFFIRFPEKKLEFTFLMLDVLLDDATDCASSFFNLSFCAIKYSTLFSN